LEEIEEKLEVDYQIGEDIKEKVCDALNHHLAWLILLCLPQIIPRAVDFFTGKALEYEAMDEDEDDFDDLDDLDEDDEAQFDDVSRKNGIFTNPLAYRWNQDSESDVEVPARRRGPPKGRGGAPAGSNVNPEECKTQ
jgi:nucleosome assembly protein 1-like 1